MPEQSRDPSLRILLDENVDRLLIPNTPAKFGPRKKPVVVGKDEL